MARRRKLTGTPLLVVTAGVAMTVGCSGKSNPGPMVTGNLMPPPPIDRVICIDTEPAEATVKVAGMIRSDRCTELATRSPSVVVEVSAPGYETELTEIEVLDGGTVERRFTLVPIEPDRIAEPVGNLMPPQEVDLIPEAKVPLAQVCVDVKPAGALVTLEGTTRLSERCGTVAVSDGSLSIDVASPGYASAHEEVPFQAGQGPIERSYTLLQETTPPPPEPPVGNLMPPPDVPPLPGKPE